MCVVPNLFMAMLTMDGCNMGTNDAHLTVQRVPLDKLYLTVCMLQQSFWQDESAIHPYDWSIYHLSSTVPPPLRIPAKLGGSLQHRGVPFCRGNTTISACMGLTTLVCRRQQQE